MSDAAGETDRFREGWIVKNKIGCTFLCILAVIAVVFSGCGAKGMGELPTIPPTCGEIPADAEALPVKPVDYQIAPGSKENYVCFYPLGTTVRYDLNGDGVGDDITLTAQQDIGGVLAIGNAAVEFEGFSPTDTFAVVNVHGDGSRLLVAYSDYGMSDDYFTVLYSYDGNGITEIGYFGDLMENARFRGDGTFTAGKVMNVLGSWWAETDYRINGNSVEESSGYYRYVGWERNGTGWDVTTKVDLIMCEEIENYDTKRIVPAGTKLSMTGMLKASDNYSYWTCFATESGEEYLWMIAELADWMTYVPAAHDIIISEEAFDGFFYAG